MSAEAPGTADFLRARQEREVVERPEDGRFFRTRDAPDGDLILIDIATGAEIATVGTLEVNQIRLNAGVRREVGGAPVQFELTDPDPERRSDALEAISRSTVPVKIPALETAITAEDDPALAARVERLLALLTARFAEGPARRVAAIDALNGDISTEARRVLNQLLQARSDVARTLPEETSIARVLNVGADISQEDAYDRLAEAGLAPPRPGRKAIRDALRAQVEGGAVAGVPVHRLDTDAARIEACRNLRAADLVQPLPARAQMDAAIAEHVSFEAYLETDSAVTDAARAALDSTRTRIGLFRFASPDLDALSLASIFFLAAPGITRTARRGIERCRRSIRGSRRRAPRRAAASCARTPRCCGSWPHWGCSRCWSACCPREWGSA